jgi:hypothetical protein
MHVLDAAAQTVHAYAGGAESLAPRIGISAGILRNKVNVNNTTNHLTLAEANEIMAASGDHRILQALAQEHGYALTRVDSISDDRAIVHHLLDVSMAEGELCRTIHDALADNLITSNEMNAIAAAGHANQAALIGLINRLRAAAKTAPVT